MFKSKLIIINFAFNCFIATMPSIIINVINNIMFLEVYSLNLVVGYLEHSACLYNLIAIKR